MALNKEKATKSFTYALYILTVGFAFAFTISGVLVNNIIEYFGLTGAAQGYMNGVLGVGNTVAILLTIVIHIKLNKASMLVLSGLLMVSMLLLTGFSNAFSMLLIVSLVLGLGLGWSDSYLNSCVVDANPVNSIKYQGTLHGLYGIGALTAPIIIAGLINRISWQGVYLTLAPIVLFTLVVYMVTLRVTKRYVNVSNEDPPKFTGKDIGLYLKDKNHLLLLAACLSYSIMQFGLFTWLVRYMSVQHGTEELGMAGITIMWIGTTVSRFVAPRLPVDSMKLQAFGAMAAGVLLFVGIFANNPWIMCVMVGVGSLTSGHFIQTLINKSIVLYQGNSLLPTSAILLMTRVAATIVPPVLGWISVYSMQGSMVVPAAAVIVSGCCGFVFLRVNK